jgi:WD40 repeat protein
MPDSKSILALAHFGQKVDDALTIRELPSGKSVRTFDDKGWWIRCLAVSPNGKLALSGHDDGRIFLWDMDTGEPVRAFDAERHWEFSTEDMVFSLFFSPDGKQAFSAYSNAIKVWDVNTGKQIERSFAEYEKSQSSHELLGHSADGRLACSGYVRLDRKDPMVKVWDLTSGKMAGSFAGHAATSDARIKAAALTPEGKYGFSAATDRTLRQWDVATGREVWKLDLGNDVTTVAFSADASLALIAHADGTIQLWDLAQRKELWQRGPFAGASD